MTDTHKSTRITFYFHWCSENANIITHMRWPLIKRRITTGDSIQIHLIELRCIDHILIIAHSNDLVAWQFNCISFVNRLAACTGLIHSRKNMRKCLVIEDWAKSMVTKWKWPATIYTRMTITANMGCPIQFGIKSKRVYENWWEFMRN